MLPFGARVIIENCKPIKFDAARRGICLFINELVEGGFLPFWSEVGINLFSGKD